jgi:D-aminopeptidase
LDGSLSGPSSAIAINMSKLALVLLPVACFLSSGISAAETTRARTLGIPFDGDPGVYNAITDVPGVVVGYSTIIDGAGEHAVRTGVTAILPRGRSSLDQPALAGIFSLNGNGEMTGAHWVDESGFLEGPVLLTNTHSVGIVRDATIQWRVRQGPPDETGYWWSLPVVAETWDGELNDVNGFHVKPEHVFVALESARGGAIEEGNVGGGTGMTCHKFKCGTGTSSRTVRITDTSYVVGALVQANYGVRSELRIAGVPVGKYMHEGLPRNEPVRDQGSIIIVIATDAPLLPHQLKRVARRAAMGLARTGSYAENGSGDIFIAFSTANENARRIVSSTVRALGNDQMDPLFLATVQVVEESIINSMIAARTMTGVNGHQAEAIDHAELRRVLKKHGRLNP